MKENEVAALIRGLAPGIRKMVSDAMTPLTARMDGIEARPEVKAEPGERGPQGEPGSPGERGPPGEPGEISKTFVPPELAEEVASAVRLMHETPPIEEAKALPPRVARIERDAEGNLVPVYEPPT